MLDLSTSNKLTEYTFGASVIFFLLAWWTLSLGVATLLTAAIYCIALIKLDKDSPTLLYLFSGLSIGTLLLNFIF